VNAVAGPARETPLHWAVRQQRTEAARALLDRGADVHARTGLGETVFHLIAARAPGVVPGPGLLDLLVAHGANPGGLLSDVEAKYRWYSSDDGINYDIPEALTSLRLVLEEAQTKRAAAGRAADERRAADAKARRLAEQVAAGV